MINISCSGFHVLKANGNSFGWAVHKFYVLSVHQSKMIDLLFKIHFVGYSIRSLQEE